MNQKNHKILQGLFIYGASNLVGEGVSSVCLFLEFSEIEEKGLHNLSGQTKVFDENLLIFITYLK